MRRLALLILLSCTFIYTNAQDQNTEPDGTYITISDSVFAEPHRVYCELLGMESGFFSHKVKISVDFGQDRSWTSDERLVDKDGKVIKFNSMIDGMNYMGQYGWKFAQAYVVTISNQNVYHWLLYKDISKESDLYEGFMTKHQFKDASKSAEKLIPKAHSYNIQFLKKKKARKSWELVNEEYYPEVPAEKIEKIISDWKSKTDDTYDYDVKIKRDR